MNNLEKWYWEKGPSAEAKGINIDTPSGIDAQYLDGKYGRYMFRFIDRGNLIPDVEIMDSVSGRTIEHNLIFTCEAGRSIYDAAIDLILNLQ